MDTSDNTKRSPVADRLEQISDDLSTFDEETAMHLVEAFAKFVQKSRKAAIDKALAGISHEELNAKLEEAEADIAAGRVEPADKVFAELKQRYGG